MTMESNVASSAISSELVAPTKVLASRSLPLIGSTPNGWAQLMPPKMPMGREYSGSIRFELKPLGLMIPNEFMIAAATATSSRTITTMAPVTAALSRLNRAQAI